MSEKIISIIAKQLAREESEIKPDCSIMDELGADSLDVVEILMAIEESTGVNVPDEAAIDIKTVGDLIAYVENNAK